MQSMYLFIAFDKFIPLTAARRPIALLCPYCDKWYLYASSVNYQYLIVIINLGISFILFGNRLFSKFL